MKRRGVSKETLPDKTEVCNFVSASVAHKTAIVGNLSGRFGTFLSCSSQLSRVGHSKLCVRDVKVSDDGSLRAATSVRQLSPLDPRTVGMHRAARTN